jgi:hypothetical protein
MRYQSSNNRVGRIGIVNWYKSCQRRVRGFTVTTDSSTMQIPDTEIAADEGFANAQSHNAGHSHL